MSDLEILKSQAAARALDFVEPGMALGLGTGSTARWFVEMLGERVRAGLKVVGVPTSEATRAQAERLRIPLTTLDERAELDLTVDGADEFDPDLNLIKGGGGALLREKIVASASRRMIVVADASKKVDRLGAFPVPVEIVPFGLTATRRRLDEAFAKLGLQPSIARRKRGDLDFVTDGGHAIFDCAFGAIPDPPALAHTLDAIVGLVEHGLFIGLASAAIVATSAGVEIFGDPHRPVKPGDPA